VRKINIIASLALLLSAAPCLSRMAFAGGTSYEAQIGGFIYATLRTLITGEFAGRRPSNADAKLDRPVCRPDDYRDLRAAADDQFAFDAFHRRCQLVEHKTDNTHVHETAYLPLGYCETLKAALETMLAERVYAERLRSSDIVMIEYKGSRFEGSGLRLARGARLQAKCQDDGSLRISAPRKRR
jgi:hypothetical protein